MEREKIHIEQAIIVEGKYDKIHLSQFVDAVIIVTNGFGIYKNAEYLATGFQELNSGTSIIYESSDIRFHSDSHIPWRWAVLTEVSLYLIRVMAICKLLSLLQSGAEVFALLSFTSRSWRFCPVGFPVGRISLCLCI